MFKGETCEERVSSSGSLSLLLFVIMVGLVVGGVLLLRESNKLKTEYQE
jgi:hypothetical protein